MIALLAAVALIGPVHHPVCTVSSKPVGTATNPLTGARQFTTQGEVDCRGRVPLYVRMCPQVKVNDQWVYVRSADGYGTCWSDGWSTELSTGLGQSDDCTSGLMIRSHVQGWIMWHGRRYTAAVAGKPYTCP